jgi:hypothetical protein
MKRKTSVFVVAIISASLISGCYSVSRFSRAADKEWDNFIESQIHDDDKIFLDQLASRFEDLAELNAKALQLLNEAVLSQKDAVSTRRALQNNSRTYLKAFKKGDHPLLSIELFSDGLARDEEIKDILNSIVSLYERCYTLSLKENDDSFMSASTEGTFHYLDMRLKNFESEYDVSIKQLLDYAYRKYERLSSYAKNHEIESLSLNTRAFSEYFKKAETGVIDDLINPLELSNKSWLNDAMVSVIELIGRHFALNKAFCAAIDERVSKMPLPRLPAQQDLIPTGIDIKLPQDIAVKKKIELVVEIQNAGDLTAQASKTLIAMPDGSKKIESVPPLKSGETHLHRFSYIIKQGGENSFTITANYQNRAFEENYSNNTMRRSLILPQEVE